MKLSVLFFISLLIIAFAFCTQNHHRVSGIITGGVGNPIVNAVISEKGKIKKDVITSDHLGRYSIRVSSPNATIVITSFIYTTAEIKVNGRKKIDVILKPLTMREIKRSKISLTP